MRTMLLATAMILTMQTLVLATASSMVMATAGAVFAERASVPLRELAMARPEGSDRSLPKADASPAKAAVHGATQNVDARPGRDPGLDPGRLSPENAERESILAEAWYLPAS